ncbi:protein kinase [Chloroflexota bacterium]
MTDLVTKTLGPYRLEQKLGEGGAAVIYRAYQESMQRYVAIKVLKVELAEQDPAFVERFTQEARTIAQLQHPHVLPVIDFGKTDEHVYMVMVLMEGGTLRRYLRQYAPLSLERSSFMLTQIASALDRAHSNQIVHRDLKPENILLDEDGNLYLTDFGLARILENARRLTKTGLLMGTPHYISPEQAKGESADQRSDIYALGVILYEMLTGQLPFQADTAYGIIFQHINNPPPNPRTIKEDIPQPVEDVVLKALAKMPQDRYQTAMAVAEGFADALPQGNKTLTVQSEKQAAQAPAGSWEAPTLAAEITLPEFYTPASANRLTPQRMTPDNAITVTDNPNDPDVNIPLPNGYMHYALRALEEVSGLQAVEIILRFAGLQDMMDRYPPNNLRFDQGYTFGQYSNLCHSILNYYGATGQEAINHIGRLSARWMIMDQPLFGFTSTALRIMPAAAALRLALNRTTDGWRKLWREVDVNMEFRLVEKGDFFLFAAKRCTNCAGKKANAPICWAFTTGLEEGSRLIKGKHYPVKQIACRAMDDPYCVWRINKKPED